MSKKWIVALVILAAAGVAGFFYFRERQASQSAGEFQTVRAERGSLLGTVGATGSVRANQTAILTWQTSGTVDLVSADVGDRVSTGDMLAELKQSSLSQAIILAQADLVSAQRSLDNLLQSGTAAAQAQVAVINAEKVVEETQKSLDNLNNKRAGQETIDNAEAKYVLAQQSVDRAQEAFDRVAHLPVTDATRASTYNTLFLARQQRDRALAELNWYRGQPDEDDFTEAEANLALAQARLEDAMREWERVKDGPNGEDVAAARARVTAIQATVNLARITAPFAGTITSSSPMPGDLVVPGTTAFRLDDLSRLLVDVQISEVDINAVTIGQQVTVTFDAILGKEYKGVVTGVGQVGTSLQGTVSFLVTVELQSVDETVKPGMTGAVTILVRELENVLLVPNRAVRIVDGQRVVYVLKNGLPERVNIRLGASSDTVSEVLSGDLQVGDLVILNPPSFFGPGGGPFGGGG